VLWLAQRGVTVEQSRGHVFDGVHVSGVPGIRLALPATELRLYPSGISECYNPA